MVRRAGSPASSSACRTSRTLQGADRPAAGDRRRRSARGSAATKDVTRQLELEDQLLGFSGRSGRSRRRAQRTPKKPNGRRSPTQEEMLRLAKERAEAARLRRQTALFRSSGSAPAAPSSCPASSAPQTASTASRKRSPGHRSRRSSVADRRHPQGARTTSSRRPTRSCATRSRRCSPGSTGSSTSTARSRSGARFRVADADQVLAGLGPVARPDPDLVRPDRRRSPPAAKSRSAVRPRSAHWLTPRDQRARRRPLDGEKLGPPPSRTSSAVEREGDTDSWRPARHEAGR